MNNSGPEQRLIIAEIKRIAELTLPPGSIVTLFGSRARGDERPDSDWDLHILIPGKDRMSASQMMDIAWPFDEIGIAHDEEINTLVYTTADWAKRSCFPFYKNVTSEGIILYQK